jgi:heme-degrading monooxygenase HmoA
MILEVAILDVKPSMVNEFETAFKTASTIIASMPGYNRPLAEKRKVF